MLCRTLGTMSRALYCVATQIPTIAASQQPLYLIFTQSTSTPPFYIANITLSRTGMESNNMMFTHFTSLTASSIASVYPSASLLSHGSVVRATVDAASGLPNIIVSGGVVITNTSAVQAVAGVWQVAADRSVSFGTAFLLQVWLIPWGT